MTERSRYQSIQIYFRYKQSRISSLLRWQNPKHLREPGSRGSSRVLILEQRSKKPEPSGSIRTDKEAKVTDAENREVTKEVQ